MSRASLATLIMTILLQTLGCSSAGRVDPDVGTGAMMDAKETTSPEINFQDNGHPAPDVLDIAVTSDLEVVADIPELQCSPGEGCFLDKCDDNTVCQSGWCVQHMGEGVCSQTCQEECPAGWSCQQVAGTDPDVIYICVSSYANLCRPCALNTDCTSTGGAEDACLHYGPDGNFCGGPCGNDGECPWGFSCKDVTTVEGSSLQQCVNDTGECPCTDSSVAMGLTTPCEVTNELGTCNGKRTCTEDSLTVCDATTPAEEACNGLDDDCDDEIDEPALVDGDYFNLCKDDNDCTTDKCTGDEGCVNEVLDSGGCDDGNPCTVADHCVDGTCIGDPVECDDNNPCTDDVCTETGGCEYPNNSDPCDDDNPCTLADQCTGGDCSGTPANCDCLNNSDCDALEDGDQCNGTLICDAGKIPFKCVVDPGTVVTCPAPEGENSFCLQANCDPGTGECSAVPNHEDFLCDNGDACIVNTKCMAGGCSGGSPVNCNDGNVCTDDACDGEVGCTNTPNESPCNDGDICTTEDGCLDGQCVGGPALSCDDGNVCNGIESCAPAGGCQDGEPLVCDDGNPCNGLETCDPVEGCAAGVVLDCDDGNPCTDDACDPQLGCQSVNNTLACSDGDVCTTGDKCSGGACLPDGELECDDANLCTADSCDQALGCLFQAGDVECNDENVCTIDLCDPATGECAFAPVADGASCDDGKECTDPDQCLAGVCSGVGPAVCPHNIYVDINSAQEVEDGTLWYPWKSIAMGLADAKPGDWVLVFPGNYEETLSMPSGVKLRSLAGASQTFIKRNQGGGVTVFDMQACSEETLIEGFTIEAGTGNGQSRCFQIWDASSPTIRNNVCIAHHWQAYAITISGKDSKPKIINNTIKGWDGGADTVSIVVSSGYPTVKNNIFIGDATSGNKNSLGIDANNGYFPELNNYNYYYKMTAATDGCVMGEGAIFDNGAPPLFIDEDSFDYRLANGSPGIDQGDPDPVYNDPDGSRNNMGAFGGPYVVVNYDPPIPQEPFPDPLPPDTVYVDIFNDTGEEDGTEEHPFDTIGEGIQYAGPGDYVRVAPGNYNEVVTMKSGIKLLGADPANTSIDGEGLGEMWMGEDATTLVNVSENSQLAGFRLLNSGYYGVYCKGITGVEMRNMIIAGIPHTGFRADNCEATLINNTFVSCGYAGITAGNMNNTVSGMNNIFANGGSIYEVAVDSSYSTYFNSSYYNGGGVGDINSDPQFQDASNGDYRLKPGSPAENSGNPAAEYTDQDGTPNDMGAFGGPKL